MNVKTKKIVVGLATAAMCLAGLAVWRVAFHSPSGKPGMAQALYYCPMHPGYTSDRPGECPICHMKLVKGAPAGALKSFTLEELVAMKPGEICLLHRCPKGPCKMAMTADLARLGKCPQCGEDLGVMVKDLMPEGYSALDLPVDRRQAIGVKIAPVKKMKIEKTLRAVGTIAHDPELYQAQAEYIEAFRALAKAGEGDLAEVTAQAGKLVESTRIRLRHLGLSDELVQEIGRQPEPDHSLLFAHPGEPVWMYAEVYEYELPLVRVGQEVRVEVPSLPGKVFTGQIRAIDAMVSPETRTTRVRVRLEDPGGELKPDLYVNAMIAVDLGEVLAVPVEAVFDTGTRKIVFIDRGGVLEPRQVTTGSQTEDYYEVRQGLNEGEMAVTSGNFLIDSESRLRAALAGAAREGHQHGT